MMAHICYAGLDPASRFLNRRSKAGPRIKSGVTRWGNGPTTIVSPTPIPYIGHVTRKG